MTTVILSDKLREKITNSVLLPFDKRIADAEIALPLMFDPMEVYHSTVLPRDMFAIFMLYPSFVVTNRAMIVRWDTPSTYEKFRIEFGRDLPIPNSVSWGTPITHIPRTIVLAPERIDAHVHELHRLREERENTKQQVKKFLASARTLQQVAKHWPTVLDHVSDEIRAKYNEVVVRTKPVRVEIDEQTKVSLVKANLIK